MDNLTPADIKVHPNVTTWTSYAGVDVETDDNGKVIGGSIEYNGDTYLAVTLAGNEDADLEVSILKSVEEEDGEPTLCAVEDEIELETVYNLIMDQIYEEEEEE